MKFKLLSKVEDAITVHPRWAIENGPFQTEIRFKYGEWIRIVKTNFSESVSFNEIGIPFSWKKFFSFPDTIEFEIKTSMHEIEAGPVIAYCVLPENGNYSWDQMEDFVSYYSLMNGLVIFCSKKGIDCEQKKIKGFFYQPSENRRFEEGTFPFPTSLYRNRTFPTELEDSLQRIIPNRWFNTHLFNKKEFYTFFSQHSSSHQHIPHTVSYTHSNLMKMLSIYKKVYLKPQDGVRAIGIYLVSWSGKKEDQVRFQSRTNESSLTLEELEPFCENRNIQHYLVQEAIEIHPYEGRHFDFRVIMQKRGDGNWHLTAAFARFGKIDGIVSNFTNSGYSIPAYKAIQTIFNTTNKETYNIIKQLEWIAKGFCRNIEENWGIYGDLGFDMAIDQNKKIWVLEINKFHDHKFPLIAMDDDFTYFQIKRNIHEYLVYLSGF